MSDVGEDEEEAKEKFEKAELQSATESDIMLKEAKNLKTIYYLIRQN